MTVLIVQWMLLFCLVKASGEERAESCFIIPPTLHSISLMINCPLKLILAFAMPGQTRPGQQRKVLLFSIWLRETPTKAAVLSSVAGWDCWHSSIPVSIVSQLEIIYCYQTHRALHYLQWHLGNYFTPIVWLIWLSVRDDLSCLFTDSGLRAYNSLPSIAQLQFGIITNMKSLMLFELK